MKGGDEGGVEGGNLTPSGRARQPLNCGAPSLDDGHHLHGQNKCAGSSSCWPRADKEKPAA
eukprot:5410124-Pyramimonas_sp.AAC.1